MAAPPFEPSLPNHSFLFDIYNDGPGLAATRGSPSSNLPGGPCGFVDLTPGANGARCGCRRFWGRSANQARGYPDNSNSVDQAVWCMCSHHACFHEDAQQAQPTPVAAALPYAVGPGQENERPRANREPLSPVQDLAPINIAASLGVPMDFPGFNFPGTPSFAGNQTEGVFPPPTTQGDVAAAFPAPDGSLPDTLAWTNFPPSQQGPAGLPPIPSQCLMPPGSPSTTASSQLRYLQPFGGVGLNTLKGKEVMRPVNDAHSVREADGPSASVPAGDSTNANTQASPQDFLPLPSAPTPKALLSQVLSPRSIHSSMGMNHGREAMKSLTDAIQMHDERLDKLENASFSVGGHEECSDRHDHLDVRVSELESRVDDVEKRLNDDNSTVVSNHHSEATPVFPDPVIHNQLKALQAQVNRLQASSLPTYNAPWELEVVILPFPLKGVWMLPNEFQSQAPSGAARDTLGVIGDEWTQLPNTHSRQTPDPPSPFVADWSDQSPGSTWLLPRACAPGRRIDERLRSRGLIKTLSVKGSDARSVHLAVSAAFGAVLRSLQLRTARRRSSHQAEVLFDRYLGLSQPWVPLRKIHKDSRLRFLTPAEMLTPTVWDAAFLMSSVIMRATGMHRLYVTQPEAYVQDQLAKEKGWTWQRLRELSPVCLDPETSSASTVDLQAAEECWQWTERLDELTEATAAAAKSPAFLGIRQDQQPQLAVNTSRSTATSSTQLFYSARSPSEVRAKSPVLVRERDQTREQRELRPPHIRTASMPLASPAMASPSGAGPSGRAKGSPHPTSKSSPYERHSSPFVGRPSPRMQMMHANPTMASMVSKRRSTRSPSLRMRNTPRWSTTSMSRSPSVVPRGMSAAPDERMRGTTPFCYATPYSTAPVDPPSRAERGSLGMPQARNMYDGNDGMAYDEEEGGHDDGDDDHGSCTDMHDDDEDMMIHGVGEGFDDEDGDINVYEDDEDDDELDDLSLARAGGPEAHALTQSSLSVPDPDAQLPPEDEPWPGIEEDHMSDGENMDPLSSRDAVDLDIDDAASDVSSQPSEYPSTQRAWHVTVNNNNNNTTTTTTNPKGDIGREGPSGGSGIGFRIHEDADASVGVAGPSRW